MDRVVFDARPRAVPRTDAMIYREVRSAEVTAPGVLSMVASDETLDRYGDIIRADGWHLAHYRKNPIVLFAHSPRDPVGTAKVRVEDTRLLADITLADPGTSEIVDAVRKLVDQKILKAASVGFRPTKPPKEILNDKGEWTGGFEFVGQDLLENSIVAIPANPNALTITNSFSPAVRRALFRPASGSLDVARAQIAVLRLGVASRPTP